MLKYFWSHFCASLRWICLSVLIGLSVVGVIFLCGTAYAGFLCGVLVLSAVAVAVLCSVVTAKDRYRREMEARHEEAKYHLQRDFEQVKILIENVRRPKDEVVYRVNDFRKSCEFYRDAWGGEDGLCMTYLLHLADLLEYYNLDI